MTPENQGHHLHKLIAEMVVAHQDDPMCCADCECNLERLAEMVARGASLHDLMPGVEYHLQCCSDCREEFQALVCILQAELKGELE
ncbi:MAG TPA: hypothetical protein PLQ56_25660 [Aggregatilineales bacterium]|nr:hypothetical protein [Aggregatilineales bacterium]